MQIGSPPSEAIRVPPRVHPFWQVINAQPAITNNERVMIQAILWLSISAFQKQTFEQIYDELLAEANRSSPGIAGPNPVITLLHELKGIMADTKTQVTRLQDDVTNLQKQLTDQGTELDSL